MLLYIHVYSICIFSAGNSRADEIVVNAFMTVFAYLYGNYREFLATTSFRTRTKKFQVMKCVCATHFRVLVCMEGRGAAMNMSALVSFHLLHLLFLIRERTLSRVFTPSQHKGWAHASACVFWCPYVALYCPCCESMNDIWLYFCSFWMHSRWPRCLKCSLKTGKTQ